MAFKIREAQWEVLLEYMGDHKDFARGKFVGAQGRETRKKMWLELANKLNALGFGERSEDKWQKTWTDFKYHLKKKGSALKLEQTATGGGAPTCPPFNSMELRAVEILGGKEFYAGVGNREVGIPISTDTNYPEMPRTLSQELGSDVGNFYTESTPTKKGKNVLKVTNKEHTCVSSELIYHDHIYADPPPKIKKFSKPDPYDETITILRDIRHSLDSFKSVVSDRLGEIAEAIRQNK